MVKAMGSRKTPGIYIHIPFCERKCTYCNFNTTDFAGDLAARYVSAVVEEIRYRGRLRREAADLRDKPEIENGTRPPAVDTIYFGGGTPSIIEAEQIAAITAACRDFFAVADNAEITIEVNPATLSQEKLDGWLRAGVNRVSVGVQSFLDRELVSLSRTHDAERARRTVAVLREAGFQNLSLDLIAGLPAQTRAGWQHNLSEALQLRPEHLSLYLLEVKEGTQLFGQIKRGQVAAPDDDLAAEMYEMICEATAGAGYEQYEISNFALASKEKSFWSQHNLKYWTDAPFYGVGCGAHSYDGRERQVNTLQTETYIEQVASSGQAVRERRKLSDEERAQEAIFMRLRLSEGVSVEEFRDDYHIDILGRYGRELEQLAEAGLVALDSSISGKRLRLTAKGRLLSNEVFLTFV